MRTRKKQRIIIGALCAIMVGMVIGYATLNQLLNISGTASITSDFNIRFKSIKEINRIPESGNYEELDNAILGGFLSYYTIDIETKEAKVTTEHQIDLTVDLKKPGSMGIYEIEVVNDGNLDGYITDITGLDEANAASPIDIKFELFDVKKEQKIRVGETKKFVLVTYWDQNATTVPTTNKVLTLKLVVSQYSDPVQDRPDIPNPSGKVEYAIGEEVYFDPIKGQRCYSDEAWNLNDKSKTCYKWNVITASDASSDTVDLLLDHDFAGDTAWISKEDYIAAGGTEEEYDSESGPGITGEGTIGLGNSQYGPLTALKHLKNGTDGWTGVETLTSSDNVTRDTLGGGTYTINYAGYKARLVSAEEIAIAAENTSWDQEWMDNLPTWLYSNIALTYDENDNVEVSSVYEHGVYWTDTAMTLDSSSAWSVEWDGFVNSAVSPLLGYGVRPVVKILKSNL